MSKRRSRPAIDRTLERVVYDHGCWVFTGSRLPAGYGRIQSDGGRDGAMTLTHRVVYEALVGPIPPRHDIDHLCRNTSCCNPMHLEPVSRAINVERGIGWRKGALAATEANRTYSHCHSGHEMTAENTYLYTTRDGAQKKYCRACRTAISSAKNRRRKETSNGTHS